MSEKIKTALRVAGILAVVAGVITLFVYDPSEANFYPCCPSRMLTGYDCPGCGSLRSLHALMHGDFGAAWRFNPAIFIAGLILAALGLAGLSRTGKSPCRDRIAGRLPRPLADLSRQMARITDHPAFALSILAAVTAWTILRNV